MEFCIYSVSIITGVDLSKIFGGQTKILWANQNMGVQKVVKSDKCMGVSQLLGAGALAAPKVYAYIWLPRYLFSLKPKKWIIFVGSLAEGTDVKRHQHIPKTLATLVSQILSSRFAVRIYYQTRASTN